jgi:hypothetical protein
MLTLKLVFIYTMRHALCTLPSDESEGAEYWNQIKG